MAPASTRTISQELTAEMAGSPVTPQIVSAPEPVPQGNPMGSPDPIYTQPGRTSMPAEELSLGAAVEKALAGFEGDDPAPAPAQRTNPAPAQTEPAAQKALVDAGDPTADLGVEPDVDTAGWTAQAARAFERVKGQRKQLLTESEQLKVQLATYESQMNELKGSLMGSESVEQLQARVHEFEQQQMFANLEGTRAFREAIANPLQQCIDHIDAVAERAGVAGETLFDIIISPEDPDNVPETDSDGFPYQTKDQRIDALLAAASPRDKASIFATMNDMEQLLAKRDQMFQKVDQAYREAQEVELQQSQVAAAAAAKQRRAVTSVVIDRIAERVPFLQEMEGLDLGKLKEEVSASDPSVLHAVDAQYHAATAKLFPFVVNDLMRAQAEIEGLVSKLAAFESAEPGAGVGSSSGFSGGGQRGSVPYGNHDTGNLTMAQAVERELANHR